MTLSTARDRTVPHVRLHAVTAALAVSLLACSQAHALGFGRAQVHSAQGSTLNITLPITELTQEDQRSLSVRLAPAAAWSQAGLKPPAPLEDMRVQLEAPAAGVPGSATRRVARITSASASDASTIDLLFVITTASGERQVQFSVLAPAPGLARPASPTPAAVGSASATSTPAGSSANSGTAAAPAPMNTRPRGNVTVRLNEHLSGISEKYPVAGATYYQMLVALWQANPGAFIENNMNLVREGQRLTIPSADAVRAVDPALAQRLYNEQLDAHAKYRARMGASAARSGAVAGSPADQGRVQSGAAAVEPAAAMQQDRLRLSGADGAGRSAGTAGSVGAGSGGASVAGTGTAGGSAAGAGVGAGAGNGASGAGAGTGAGARTGAGASNGAAASSGAGLGAAAAAGVAGLTSGATADERTSNHLALKDVADRVNQLQRNVDDLKAAGAGASGSTSAATSGGATGANGTASGANAPGSTGTTAAGGVGGASRVGPLGGTLPDAAGAAGSSTDASGANGATGSGTSGSGTSGSGATGSGATGNGTSSGGNAATGTGAATGAGSSQGTGGAAAPGNMGATGAAGTGGSAGAAGATGAAGAAGAAGATGAAAAGATSNATTPGTPGDATSHSSSTAGADGAGDNNGSLMSVSGLPAWLTDNLLIVLTAVLALIAFIIAWVVRRAAARREDQSDSDLSDDEPSDRTIDPVLIEKRLDGIDLDLNNPPTDEPGTSDDTIRAEDRRARHGDSSPERRT